MASPMARLIFSGSIEVNKLILFMNVINYFLIISKFMMFLQFILILYQTRNQAQENKRFG